MTLFDPFDDRACRVCGCTETSACFDARHGPCWWVEDDLCSRCAMKAGRRRLLALAAVVTVTIAAAVAAYLRSAVWGHR